MKPSNFFRNNTQIDDWLKSFDSDVGWDKPVAYNTIYKK